MIRFILNGNDIATSLAPGLTLLDFIRYHQHLTGTKIGCREGDCGACTVLVGELKGPNLQYRSMTSCLVPLGNAASKHIVTIEGLNESTDLNPIQQAMADEGATQCGFCTPGFVVSLAGFCLSKKEATKENIIAALDGNICRCTGYKSIERAAAKVAESMKARNGEEPSSFVAKQKILPGYFSSIKTRLQTLLNGQHPLTSDSYRDHAPITVVGGGTDLYVQKHDDIVHAPLDLVFDNSGLKGITKEGNKCIIGASVTVTDLMESDIIKEGFPGFHRYTKLISSTPIRNMATIAGNFINASPIGDFTIFFLALNADIELHNSSNGQANRIVPLRKLYKGYKQLDKHPDEIITKISFELPAKNSYFNFEKVSKRTNLDIASVNTAIYLQIKNDVIENAGVSAGGVAPVPLYLQKTSEFLKGKTITEQLVDEAIAVMQTEISPINDARGSKEYKVFLLGQLIKSHFITLFPKLNFYQLLS